MIPTLVQQVEAAAAADAAARQAAFAARYADAAPCAAGKARLDRGILAALEARPGSSAAALSLVVPALGFSAKSLVNILGRMERATWVERLPPPPGRKTGPGVPLRYAITDAGRALLARFDASAQPHSPQEH